MGVQTTRQGTGQVPATIDDHRRSSALTLFLGIVGGIAAFVGGFILLGDDRGTVDIGGMVSWQVSEIDPLWGYGLLIGGALALLGALSWHCATAARESPCSRLPAAGRPP